MRLLRTTRCCAIAIVVACASILVSTQSSSFFPVRTVWTLALGERLSAPPLFTTSAGYIPIAGKGLAAYELLAGSQIWLVDADVRAKPAAGNDLIFIAEEGALSALHAADGSRSWRVPLDSGPATPAVWGHGWLIVPAQSGAVLSFRASEGRLAWQRDLGSPAHASATLTADIVYVPLADGRVVALRVDTGMLVWERKLGGPPNDLIALDDRLFVGSLDNFFYALNPKDGRTIWRWPTGGDVIGLPIVDERRVYFVSLDNVLYALNRKSGSLEWRRPLPIRPKSGPVRAADTLIVGGSEPNLYAYQIKDGRPAGNVPAEAIAAPLFVADGGEPGPMLIVVTDDLLKGPSITAIGHQTEAPATPAASPEDRFE